MKESNKKKISIGVVLLLFSAGLIAAAPISVCDNGDDGNQEQIIIRIKTSNPSNSILPHDRLLPSRLFQKKYSVYEQKISISTKDSIELETQLEFLKSKLENAKNQEEKIALYTSSFELLKEYTILPESFTIEALQKSTSEITQKLRENKDIFPRIFQNKLSKLQLTNNKELMNNDVQPFDNNVQPGDARIDIGSAFFIVTLLSEINPWNIVPNPLSWGNATEINITDFTFGQALVDMTNGNIENYSFPIGWTAGIGNAILYTIPGNALVGGEALLSWPSATPMLLYIYSGSSLIIPIGFITCSLTILLDRGPRQVPIPLFDAAVVGSLLTVHMPYSKDPDQ